MEYKEQKMDITGLIPAGGISSRLGRIPCSKEVFPIPDPNAEGGVSVVSEHLLQCFKKAGIETCYVIIRRGKWDIPDYYGNGSHSGINIGYLVVDLTPGTPFTLDHAYPFVKDKIVALGFPDIFFEPEDAYSELLKELSGTDSDVVLGIFPVKSFLKWDMVEFDDDNRIKNIVIKQDRPDLTYGWTNVVWRPSFTRYMNHYLKEFIRKNPDGKVRSGNHDPRELYVGDVIQAAMADGLKVGHVMFGQGSSLDIGTPDDLQNYLRKIL
ncbi:MAG: hypothetical protein PVF73_05870 [Bacteroidales bacterium]|jgi:glucose-1-phosphate thymidylyltransferase